MRLRAAAAVILTMLVVPGCSFPSSPTPQTPSAPAPEAESSAPTAPASVPVTKWEVIVGDNLARTLESSGAVVETVGPYPEPDRRITNVIITVPAGTVVAPADPFRVVLVVRQAGRTGQQQVAFEELLDDGTRQVKAYEWTTNGRFRRFEGRYALTGGERTYMLTGEIKGMTPEIVARVARGSIPPPEFR